MVPIARIRKGLPGETAPKQRGLKTQRPSAEYVTARWVVGTVGSKGLVSHLCGKQTGRQEMRGRGDWAGPQKAHVASESLRYIPEAESLRKGN